MNSIIHKIGVVVRPWRWKSLVRNRWNASRIGRIVDLYLYDARRFLKYAGVFNHDVQSDESRIVMAYHVLEKGLTMPRRRLNFGHDAVLHLMGLIESFKNRYSSLTLQCEHAIGVLKAYRKLHVGKEDDATFWNAVDEFLSKHCDVPTREQFHLTSAEFYRDAGSSFDKFAKARHTLRQYEGSVSDEAIKNAVELALTSPSACNRQHVRVVCVSNRTVMNEVLSIQHGNRGFGDLADKLLIITGDLRVVGWAEERNDIYTNCGIFLMNLCYGLFYNHVAHCILNWSERPSQDRQLHQILNLPDSQVVAAMIVCGGTPKEIDVALSPRRDVKEILSVIE